MDWQSLSRLKPFAFERVELEIEEKKVDFENEVLPIQFLQEKFWLRAGHR
jgi:hypothetical protein